MRLYLHFQNQGVILEYQLPLNSKRLDCIVCGKDNREIFKEIFLMMISN